MEIMYIIWDNDKTLFSGMLRRMRMKGEEDFSFFSKVTDSIHQSKLQEPFGNLENLYLIHKIKNYS